MTTKYKLLKLSEPGWELEFDTLQQAGDKLLSCLCGECKEDTINDIIEGMMLQTQYLVQFVDVSIGWRKLKND